MKVLMRRAPTCKECKHCHEVRCLDMGQEKTLSVCFAPVPDWVYNRFGLEYSQDDYVFINDNLQVLCECFVPKEESK